MNKINERELEKLFLELKNSNNRGIVETLYSKYNKLIYGIAFSILKNKEDSEDIVQTVFEKIYTMPKDKLPQHNISSWIYSITKNLSISLLRKKRNTVDLDKIYEIVDINNEINNIINQDNYNRLISRLNNKEKEIVSLKILANLSFDEISKLLNEPTGTVKWRYYKSIHTLKLLLSNLGMFIITFIIGLNIINLRSKDRKHVPNIEQKAEDNKMNTDSENNRAESIKDQEKGDEEIKDFANEINNIIQEETKEEIVAPIENNINYYGIGILTASGVFLIFTIIFSIFLLKYQLKQKVKASK